MTSSRRRRLPGGVFIWTGVAAAAVYWILEAAVDAVFFGGRTFANELVSPTTHEMWMRSVGTAMFVLLGVVAQMLMNQRCRAEEETRRINRILSTIRKVNQILVRAEDRETMLRQACHTLIEGRGYYNAWIALMDEDNNVTDTVEAGRGKRFSLIEGKMAEGWLPNCAEQALSKPDCVVIEKPAWDCAECPAGEQYAGRSALACRLEHAGVTYGFICVSIPKEYARSEREQALLTEAADDIAFTLHKLMLEEQQGAMEAAVRESEERYRRLFETAQDGMLILDASSGEIIDANPYLREIIGYSKEELKGRHLWDIGSFRDIAENKEKFDKLRDEGYVRYEHLPLQTKSGEEAAVEFVSNTYQAGGKTVIQCNIRDVTERKKAQRELEESEEKYRAIVENSHDAIYIYRGTQFLFVNDRVAEVTGYSKEELYHMDPFALFHPDDQERIEDIARRRAQGEDVPNTYQARIIDKEGDVRVCEFAVTDITYKGEYAALGSVRDITQQKMAEEQLRQSEKEKTLILDTSPALIAYQDTSHRVIWANRAAAESVNETPEDLKGRRCYEIWHQRDEPCEGCPIEQAIETGEMHEGEISSPDGRYWLIRGSPVRDEQGNVAGAVETTLDITERKQAEEEMERALEQEKLFKLKAAHHFFNPLAISKGYMTIAMEELPEEHHATIQQAHNALKRIERVVRNIVERGEIHE